MRKKSELTPRKEKLYSLTKKYLQLARQSEEKNLSNLERLNQLIYLTETGEVFKDKLNPSTWDFVM
jgi:hypothetical protein